MRRPFRLSNGAVDVLLETTRLILRRFTEADVDDLVELDSDPDVMRYINGGRPTPREEIADDILPAYLRYHEKWEAFGFWAAIEKSTGDFVGWFHFLPQDDSNLDVVELGYRLRKSSWGMGLATEGSRALIDKGFRDLGTKRVFAETMVVNTASRRVMEKAGLEFDHIFHAEWPDRIEGDEHGDVQYALTREKWERRRTSS